MVILIFEPDYGGHRLKYVKFIIDAYCEYGYKIILATKPETIKSIQYKEFLSESEHKFKLHFLQLKEYEGNLLIRHIRRGAHFLRLIKQNEDIDIAFVPYLDNIFYSFGVLSLLKLKTKPISPVINGILFRGDYVYADVEQTTVRKIKKLMSKIIIDKGFFSNIFIIDELLYSFYNSRKHNSTSSHLIMCPDPIEIENKIIDTKAWKLSYGIPEDSKIIGAFGEISDRKGIDILIKTFIEYGPSPQEFLFLMGLHSKSIVSILNGLNMAEPVSRQIISINHFVPDTDFAAAISACDVVAATYPFHIGSASIVIRAAAACKPVLGSNVGWIGTMIKKYDLGICCNINDREELMQSLKWAFTNPMCNRENAYLFAVQNSISNFKKTIVS